MATADKMPVIDADAHVVESAHTWDYMDSSEKQYRPIPLETREEAGVKLQFWVIDGKVRGFRFPLSQPKSWKNDPSRLVANSPTTRNPVSWVMLICACSTWMTPELTSRCCTIRCLSSQPRIARPSRSRYAKVGTAGWRTSGARERVVCAGPAWRRP